MRRKLKRLARIRFGVTHGIDIARADWPLSTKLAYSGLFASLYRDDTASYFRHAFYKTLLREISR